MNIYYSKKFGKEYKKLPLKIKLLAEKSEATFRNDPHNPGLKTHKLKGVLKDFYSFSLAYSYRVVFSFEEDGSVTFETVGTHSIYK